MPRRETPFAPGEGYHLYNRGVNRRKIFFEHRNYLLMLFNIERYLLPYISLVAYCLMPTHYHLLVVIKDKIQSDKEDIDIESSDISKAMMKFSVSYTKSINIKYDRVGPLFQGAYQSKQIATEEYYYQLIDYIHDNPMRADLVEKPTDWLYSSIHDYLRNEKLGYLDIDLGSTP